ncbi:hypothetical protein OROGR_005418 [Orobanche gracilis]
MEPLKPPFLKSLSLESREPAPGMSLEEVKARFPRRIWDREYREKLSARAASLPKEKLMAISEQRRKKKMELQKPESREKRSSCKDDPHAFQAYPLFRLSPSEFHQYKQSPRFMESARMAIKSYNEATHSDFEVVTVEYLKTHCGRYFHHEMTFSARDAKEPSAASLTTFEACVTFDGDYLKEVLYCKHSSKDGEGCVADGCGVVLGKNLSED